MINFLKRYRYGFTLVELSVAIVVVAIITSIVVVGYGNWQGSVAEVQVKSDLTNVAAAMKNAVNFNDVYPSALPTTFEPSDSVSLSLIPHDGTNFCIDGTSSTDASIEYYIDNYHINAGPQQGTCDSRNFDCGTTGFIFVSGNANYGTRDFCVMKYEAKNVAGVATSQASDSPWTSITQLSAISNSAAVCSDCRLMTDPEWMTIARNVLKVKGNWSGGDVGSGYIYRGHSDSSPYNALAASVDADPFYGTGQSEPSIQKRTLNLINGQVIWDIAGNVYEWTDATIDSGQYPGYSGGSTWEFIEWDNGSLSMNGLPYLSQPQSTGLSNIVWNSSRGVGNLWSNYSTSETRAFLRGGTWAYENHSGVLSLLFNPPDASSTGIGFRVSKPYIHSFM